jgi:hypothetical protein
MLEILIPGVEKRQEVVDSWATNRHGRSVADVKNLSETQSLRSPIPFDRSTPTQLTIENILVSELRGEWPEAQVSVRYYQFSTGMYGAILRSTYT